jgi:hypothetical protein
MEKGRDKPTYKQRSLERGKKIGTYLNNLEDQ